MWVVMRRELSGAVVLLACANAAGAAVPHVEYANADNPGERVKIKRFVEPGKITIIEVGSRYCPDCLKSAPLLDELKAKNPDFKIVHLSINQKGVEGVQKNSPLRKECAAHYVPHFIVFDKTGKKIAESNRKKNNPRPLIAQYLKDNGVDAASFALSDQ